MDPCPACGGARSQRDFGCVFRGRGTEELRYDLPLAWCDHCRTVALDPELVALAGVDGLHLAGALESARSLRTRTASLRR